ncbi:MAG: hypothetical protein IAG13_23355, partial [Deltaproteobacteria bacterium]|nr:hypothetical protein [Nannocystaceae bacterium]
MLRFMGRLAKGLAKALAWLVGSVLLLVVLVLVVVLYTPWGTRTALGFALDFYDDMIPGAVAVEGIDGTLGGTLVIDALTLSDAEDNPLVDVRALRLQLRLADLVHLTVGFDELALGGLEIWFGGDRAAFGDLGPPGPAKPKPEGMVGPDLPIGFLGPLAIDGIVVHRNLLEGGDEVLVAVPQLRARLDSKGRAAALQLDGVTAILDSASLAIAGLTGAVHWDDPNIRIDDLVVLSNRGVITHADLGFDAYQQTGDVDLAALIDIAGLAPDSKLPIHGLVPLSVKAAGGAQSVWAHIVSSAEPEARVDLLLGGSIAPRMQLAGTGVVQLVPPGAERPFASFLAVQAFRLPDLPMLAWAQLRCIGCSEPVGANAQVAIDLVTKSTDIDARVYLADSSVTASASIDDGALIRARAEVGVPSIRGLGGTLSPWLPSALAGQLTQIGGSLGADASCHGGTGLLRCTAVVDARALEYTAAKIAHVEVDATVELRDGRPSGAVTVVAEQMQWQQHRIDSLRVDAHGDRERIEIELGAKAKGGRVALVASVEPGPRTAIGVQELALDLQTLHARLDGPTTVTVGGGTVDIDGLRMTVNKGVLEADGVIGEDSDATVAIERFELGDLGPLKLPVRLSGTIDARAQLRGRTKDPQLSLVAAIDRLWVEKHELGHIGVEAGLDRGKLDAHVDWKPGADARERVELRA